MAILRKLRSRYHGHLHNLRLRLSGADAIPQLALLGIITGIAVGAIMIAFRLFIEFGQDALLGSQKASEFESLSMWVRFLLPATGGILIGLLLHSISRSERQIGVVHVMERLAYHQGHLPFRNALVQFFGASISIMFGHSVGREGPSIHLGAASASLIGQQMQLPNNSIRTLVACGVAAAIAASFNTPLAGIIFAMEVVMMEYTLAGFAPVIVAAVSATTITQIVFGGEPAFTVPSLQLGSLKELPYILLLGATIGALAAMFTQSILFFNKLAARLSIWQSCSLAGILIGFCALPSPEIMGIGYDTVTNALLGNSALFTLIVVVVFKLLASTAAVGLGLPGGLIAPTLVVGAAAGGAFGLVADYWSVHDFSSPGLYALIGMGAMMGATLQAPLAALTAMLELTGNLNVVMPAMLALITAGLVSKELFGKESVFIELIRARGLDYQQNPVTQALQRVGVANAMERGVAVVPVVIDRDRAKEELEQEPRWIVINDEDGLVQVMPAADLARALSDTQERTEIHLLEIPAQRFSSTSIILQANVQEALETMNQSGIDTLHVVQKTVPGVDRIIGVLTRNEIERSYQL